MNIGLVAASVVVVCLVLMLLATAVIRKVGTMQKAIRQIPTAKEREDREARLKAVGKLVQRAIVSLGGVATEDQIISAVRGMNNEALPSLYLNKLDAGEIWEYLELATQVPEDGTIQKDGGFYRLPQPFPTFGDLPSPPFGRRDDVTQRIDVPDDERLRRVNILIRHAFAEGDEGRPVFRDLGELLTEVNKLRQTFSDAWGEIPEILDSELARHLSVLRAVRVDRDGTIYWRPI